MRLLCRRYLGLGADVLELDLGGDVDTQRVDVQTQRVAQHLTREANHLPAEKSRDELWEPRAYSWLNHQNCLQWKFGVCFRCFCSIACTPTHTNRKFAVVCGAIQYAPINASCVCRWEPTTWAHVTCSVIAGGTDVHSFCKRTVGAEGGGGTFPLPAARTLGGLPPSTRHDACFSPQKKQHKIPRKCSV